MFLLKCQARDLVSLGTNYCVISVCWKCHGVEWPTTTVAGRSTVGPSMSPFFAFSEADCGEPSAQPAPYYAACQLNLGLELVCTEGIPTWLLPVRRRASSQIYSSKPRNLDILTDSGIKAVGKRGTLTIS